MYRPIASLNCLESTLTQACLFVLIRHLTLTKYLIFNTLHNVLCNSYVTLSLSCHCVTSTSPTRIHYNITFYKISRRKEGGGGKGKYKTQKIFFLKKFFGKNILGPKSPTNFWVGLPRPQGATTHPVRVSAPHLVRVNTLLGGPHLAFCRMQPHRFVTTLWILSNCSL